jgi:membrane fusion protein (multidrug efflux system)
VPVRIALDAKQLAAHPLRLGLSMTVSVDVSDTSGRTLAEGARSTPVAQTQVFDVITAQADAEVARIIATHGGAPRKPAVAVKPVAAAPDKAVPARPTNPATRR